MSKQTTAMKSDSIHDSIDGSVDDCYDILAGSASSASNDRPRYFASLESLASGAAFVFPRFQRPFADHAVGDFRFLAPVG